MTRPRLPMSSPAYALPEKKGSFFCQISGADASV